MMQHTRIPTDLCVNQTVYQCLSWGRGAKMTNKTCGTASAAVAGAWWDVPQSLAPSEGWKAGSLIRTSCQQWWPPQPTEERASEAESGTSWQSDPGPVAPALALRGHSDCLPRSAHPERGQPRDFTVGDGQHKDCVLCGTDLGNDISVDWS